MSPVDTHHSNQDSAGSGGPGTALTGAPTEDFSIKSHLQPESIEPVAHLAQDTIAATSGVPSLRDEPGALATFKNPYTGVEEVLYVADNSGAGTLYWFWQGHGPQDSGWRVDHVVSGVESAAVAVHPNGKVYAFCTTGTSFRPSELKVLELTQEANGSLQWVPAAVDPNGEPSPMKPSLLFVQYLSDRPATPVVFAVDIRPFTSPRAHILVPAVSGQAANGVSWQYRWYLDLSADDLAGLGAMGVEDEYMLASPRRSSAGRPSGRAVPAP